MSPETFDLKKLFSKHQIAALGLRRETLSSRKQKLKMLREWIYESRKKIHEAMDADLGKPPTETDVTEIYPLLTEVKHAISQLEEWASPESIPGSVTYLGTVAEIHYEPKGTVLIISPWNYPLLLALGPVVSAIAAGNAIILKPSEFTPVVNALIGEMFKCLFSLDEVVLVQGKADVATSLLMLPFDHIFFTGSPEVGKIVMKAAAENLTSVTLELGGKSPTIVDETAHIRDAARKIAWAKWVNAGQTCVAPDYVFVHELRKELFCKELIEAVKEFYADDQDYTSIIHEKHYKRIQELYDDAINSGAVVEYGGDSDYEQNKIYPLVLSGVNDSMRLMQEEIFGPILPIMVYNNISEVISYVNERPKPLALYLYSTNHARQERVLLETSSGSVVFNDSVLQFGHPHMSFGGVSTSGIGKAHGRAGFLAFSHNKAVLRQRVGITALSLLYPPYSKWKKKLVALMLRFF